ncbi:glycosyltransferase family 4 protein [bacterium]|nr:glycosyltransferase family 4 protein [bacterium]MBQ6435948.1 glycosyltransferase family 4 protein [bacterium]
MKDEKRVIRIAVDGNEANCLHRVGSNVYAYEMLLALSRLTRRKQDVDLTVFLAQPPVSDMPGERQNWHYRVVGPRVAWTQWGLPLYLWLHRGKFDVFYTPGHYAPRMCPLPYVSSIMDLAFWRYPDLFAARDLYQLENWTRYSARGAAKIVAISEFSKHEVMKYYGRKDEDVVVAYPALTQKAVNLPKNEQKQVLTQLEVTTPYFLYLGTLQPRKNIRRIIDAFENLKLDRDYSAYKLVLAGKNGWLTDEIYQTIAQSTAYDDIVQTGFVTAREKGVLLQNATATLNVGLYEGFGIPALESLSYGTLPIVAGNTSLPEAVGNACLSVNPFKTASIAKAMVLAATFTPSERQRFLRLARRQVQKFSYERSARVVLDTLLQVVAERS